MRMMKRELMIVDEAKWGSGSKIGGAFHIEEKKIQLLMSEVKEKFVFKCSCYFGLKQCLSG